MTVVFDKLSFMRHLESEGTFARPQAEKLSEAFHQAIQETVATRADIERLEARIDSMDARIDAKLAGGRRQDGAVGGQVRCRAGDVQGLDGRGRGRPVQRAFGDPIFRPLSASQPRPAG